MKSKFDFLIEIFMRFSLKDSWIQRSSEAADREAVKISALSSGKIHEYKYLTGEEISPSTLQQIIEQAKFTYSPLGKAFENQIKTIEDQGKKQVEALKAKAIADKSDNNPPISK